MSAALGLCLGLGLFLVWSSFWTEPRSGTPSRARLTGLEAALRHAGLETTSVRMLLAFCGTAAVVSGLLGLAVTRIGALGFCALVAGGWAPIAFVRWRARRARARVRQLWPDVVDHLRSAIRAGLSLPEALSQLQYRGPEPLRPAFAAFGSDYRASGDFEASLNRFKDRMADPVADNLVEALRVTREVGGTDLGRLLGTLAEFLRDSARTRSELEARQSWTVNAARLALAAPWVVLVLMSTQPAALRAYNSPAGYAVMLGGAVVSLLAYHLMQRLGALPVERRVLA